MRSVIPLLLLIYISIGWSQTDSLFIKMNNGICLGYSINSIHKISFSHSITDVKEQQIIQQLITSFTLHQNYPNPFNPSTTIEYEIPTAGNVEIDIFDIRGRLIRSLNKSRQQKGMHVVLWDGCNDYGIYMASGIYFCRVKFGNKLITKKLTLIK